jgi:hypothetical protein
MLIHAWESHGKRMSWKEFSSLPWKEILCCLIFWKETHVF